MKQKKVIILVPEDLHRAARIKAAITGIPVARVCREALQKWVAEDAPAQVAPQPLEKRKAAD